MTQCKQMYIFTARTPKCTEEVIFGCQSVSVLRRVGRKSEAWWVQSKSFYVFSGKFRWFFPPFWVIPTPTTFTSGRSELGRDQIVGASSGIHSTKCKCNNFSWISGVFETGWVFIHSVAFHCECNEYFLNQINAAKIHFAQKKKNKAHTRLTTLQAQTVKPMDIVAAFKWNIIEYRFISHLKTLLPRWVNVGSTQFRLNCDWCDYWYR